MLHGVPLGSCFAQPRTSTAPGEILTAEDRGLSCYINDAVAAEVHSRTSPLAGM